MGTILFIIFLIWIFGGFSSKKPPTGGGGGGGTGPKPRPRPKPTPGGGIDTGIFDTGGGSQKLTFKHSYRKAVGTLQIKIKGKPSSNKNKLGIIISLFDITDGKRNKKVVHTTTSRRQEEGSKAFYFAKDITNHGYSDWYGLCNINTGYLETPKGTMNRKIQIIIRLVNWDDKPGIKNGNIKGGDKKKVLNEWTRTSNVTIANPGYEEQTTENFEAIDLAIQLGVAVAMSDGRFAASEKEILQIWMKKQINPYRGEKKKELKERYIKIFKKAYYDAKEKPLDIESLAIKLKALNLPSFSKEVLQLSHHVMEADGVIDPNEVKVIELLKTLLHIEPDPEPPEPDRTREELLMELGIDPSLPDHQIRKILTDEFQKWSNRLNIVPPEKREEVQERIDLIALARNEYD